MITKNFKPTSWHLNVWRPLLGQLPCMFTLADPKQCQLHHIRGAAFQHGGHWLGEDLIIPIWWNCHDVTGTHFPHVSRNKLAFESKYGNQLKVWVEMCRYLYTRSQPIPPIEKIQAVKQLAGMA